MQINRDNEREIDLRDLFFHLLYRWRSITLAALIGAILLGGYRYVDILITHREGKQTLAERQYEIELQNYNNSLRNTRGSIKSYINLIHEKNDYLDESLYIGLDAQNEWITYKRYYIRMDQAVLDARPEGLQEDPADYVVATYITTLKSGLDPEEMESLLGTSRREYIDELVTIGTDAVANTITLQVIGASREDVTRQIEYFTDRMTTVSAPKAQEVGAHTLVLVEEDTHSRIDNNLSTKQNEINNILIEWQETLKEKQEMLNDLEEKGEPTLHRGIGKSAVIGFLLGAFLLAGIYVGKYILEGKLRRGRELTECYGLPIYGEYEKSRARRSGKGLDKWFEAWEFKHKSEDEAVAGAAVRLLIERHGGKRVLLTGTISKDKIERICRILQAKLGDEVRLEAQGEFLTNSAAITAAAEADAVLIVEEKNVSRNIDIEREAELLTLCQADVNGCIVS